MMNNVNLSALKIKVDNNEILSQLPMRYQKYSQIYTNEVLCAHTFGGVSTRTLLL